MSARVEKSGRSYDGVRRASSRTVIVLSRHAAKRKRPGVKSRWVFPIAATATKQWREEHHPELHLIPRAIEAAMGGHVEVATPDGPVTIIIDSKLRE